MKKIFSVFDKKRFLFIGKFIFIFIAMTLIINLFSRTYTRYESSATLNTQANVAFFLIDQGTYESTISLSDLIPSSTPSYYSFYVANYSDSKRTKVDMNYTIKFETTTNLPLTYEVVRNENFNGNYTNIISSQTTRVDDDGVFYKDYLCNQTYSFTHSSNQVDNYLIKVTFPLSYKYYPDYYQGTIELFSIIIDASQVA